MRLLPPRSPLFPYTTLFRSPTGVATSSRVSRSGTCSPQARFCPSARKPCATPKPKPREPKCTPTQTRSEEHTSELQSHSDLVCRLLLEKKKNTKNQNNIT